MRKFLIYSFLFFCFIGISKASDPNVQEHRISELSSGQYSYAPPNEIPDNAAALIQNFYTDTPNTILERNGTSILDSGLGGAASDGRGVWKFVDVNKNEWIIEFSSKTFYKHLLGGAATAFGLSATTTNVPRAVTNLGKIWFVNGVDSLWWFDGTSTGSVSGAPLGRLITAWRNRLVISNISSSQSTVRFSADGDGTSWTLAGNPTDPFSIQIGGANDGYQVNCMGIYSDYLVIQRKYDSWIVSGFDQADVVTRNISQEVGCTESGSNREFDGSYIFLSARGMEEMTGTIIKRISDPIRDITDNIVKNSNSQRSIIQTSQSDFAAGSITSGTNFYADTTTTSGRIQTTFPDTFDSLRNGTSSTKSVWISSNGATTSPSSTFTANGTLNIAYNGNSTQSVYLQSASQLGDFSSGASYYITVSSFPYFGGGFERFDLAFASTSFSTRGVNPADSPGNQNFSTSLFFRWLVASTNTATLSNIRVGSSDQTLVSTTTNVPFTFTVWLSTSNFSYSVNGVQVSASTHTFTRCSPYVGLAYYHGGNGTGLPATLQLDNFQVAPQTFTFQSSLFSIGTAVTAWGNLDVTENVSSPSGAITYQFGSTSTASVGSIVNWTSVSDHAVPSVSTNPYAAVRAIWNETAASGFTASIDDITVNWLEGSAPAMASVVYDGRYWLAYTDQTGSSPINNKCLVYQRNRTWVTNTIGAASFAIWRDHLYYGDSALTGNFYQFDIGNNDNGSAINSQITFKSYDMGIGWRDKDLNRAYLSFYGSPVYTSTFTLSYIVDQDGVTNSLGYASMNDGTGQVLEKFWFPMSNGPLQFQEIQYILTHNSTGDRLKLFDILTNFRPKEER